MKPIYHAPAIRQAGKFFDKPPESAILDAIEMNTTFTKLMQKHAPVHGYSAIWQRCSRIVGVVGTKF
jgi:hypothetical protein